jgi:predicted nuclease with TOPRIM domain
MSASATSGLRTGGAVAIVAVALACASCGGDDVSGQADAGTSIPGETTAAATTGADDVSEQANLKTTAEQISRELDATLVDLRNVESLDELRDDLEETSARVQSWREQLAAAPEDEELAEARTALDEAFASLETTLTELSSQSEGAGQAELGDLARQLTPDNLEPITDARDALDDLVGADD